ncbi:uncharacterized protein LOC142767137 [Rhipicephalus microplus]|uniref:uncharacterized protein LOC142767137 n=1 Tax=Rhipicephalus microplus TaxID=6941 RepID=UPI003F6BCB5F
MPGITTRHTQPNNFEKMRVTYAFQLFSDTVLNGLRLYKNDVEAKCGSIQPVLTFFGMMRDLIEIMSSRFPAKALRPDSAAVDKLLSFLAYLVEWEVYVAENLRQAKNEGRAEKRGRFLSESTAVGLRVTIASDLLLLDYLSQQLAYKFIMTSRLSQDPAENFFGIARQSSGCNTHPTPQQFLITVSCLSFYSLAKSVSHGNAEPGILTALLGADAAGGDDRTKQFLLDQLTADGDLCSAELALNSIEKAAPDHVACVSAKSDERLIFYVAGYVTRKFLAKTSCDACKNVLLADKNNIKNLQAAQLTQLKDNGGLLYPSCFLFRFLKNLENLFTGCFSAQELHHESIMDEASGVGEPG